MGCTLRELFPMKMTVAVAAVSATVAAVLVPVLTRTTGTSTFSHVSTHLVRLSDVPRPPFDTSLHVPMIPTQASTGHRLNSCR